MKEQREITLVTQGGERFVTTAAHTETEEADHIHTKKFLHEFVLSREASTRIKALAGKQLVEVAWGYLPIEKVVCPVRLTPEDTVVLECRERRPMRF